MPITERRPQYDPTAPSDISPYYQITPELKALHDEGLRQVQRWENGFMLPTKKENDREHIDGMQLIAEELASNYKILSREINFKLVYPMNELHEDGEIGKGDLCHMDPEYDEKKHLWKKKERQFSAWMYRKNILDIRQRHAIWRLYKRTTSKHPSDREAQTVDLIDKVQGVRFGRQFVFNAKEVKKGPKRNMLSNNIQRSFGLIGKPVGQLLLLLPNDANSELLNFFGSEITDLTHYGYKKEVNDFMEGFQNCRTPQEQSAFLLAQYKNYCTKQ